MEISHDITTTSRSSPSNNIHLQQQHHISSTATHLQHVVLHILGLRLKHELFRDGWLALLLLIILVLIIFIVIIIVVGL